MGDQRTDVSSLVEYRRDKWLLERVPWAMWFCVGGLAFVMALILGIAIISLIAVVIVLVVGTVGSIWPYGRLL